MAAQRPRSALTRRSFVLGGVGTLALTATGCRRRDDGPPTASDPTPAPTTTAAVEEATHWPAAGGPWETVDPAGADWDVDALEAALDLAGERATESVLVLLEGRVLAERHFGVEPGHQRDIASCQKSVVALLVVMARDRGLLDLDDPVTDHLGAGWSNAAPAEEAAITVRHLLSMTSGLDDGLRRMADPGSRWRYTNPAYHVLRHVLERVTGTDIDSLNRDWLWNPIGAGDASWYERPGRPDPKGRPLPGLRMHVHDMARLGVLVQRGGEWDGTSVVAPESVDEVLAPSQERNPAYGLLWWRLDGRIPGAPSDVVAALGKGDQKLYVSRSAGLVVARLGEQGGSTNPTDPDSFNVAFWTALAGAMPA